MEPTAAENDIAGENGYSSEDRKGTKSIKDAAAELVISNGDSLKETTENQSLHGCGHYRPEAEGNIPEARPLAYCLRAKIEGDTPQSQRQHHDNDRQVERRHQNAVSDRKSGQQRNSGHDKPSFVSIPHGHDRVDYLVTQVFVGLAEQQGPDAEVESVEHYIERNGQCGECCGKEWQVHGCYLPSPG